MSSQVTTTMKIKAEVQAEKPWAKEYFQLVGCKPFSPILKANIKEDGSIFIEAADCKAYLFPGSQAAKGIAEWFEANHGETVAWLGLAKTEDYPYWEFSDEADLVGLVHTPFDGKCTVSPKPTEPARARKANTKPPF